VLVVALVCLLRLPTLFEPPYFGDEGIFAAVASRLLEGEQLYTDAWDNKPPLIYLLYAAVMRVVGLSIAGLRLVGAVWAVGTALVVLALARRVAPPGPAAVAAVTFALLSSTPFLQGTLLLTEALAALPVAAGVFLVLDASAREGTARDRRLFFAGVLFGLGCCVKQVAALDAAAAGLWLLLRPGRPLPDIVWLAGGWLAPVALVALWLTASGAAREAWQAVFWGYCAYLGERPLLPGWFRVLSAVPAVVGVGRLLWVRRHGGSSADAADLALLWFGFAVVAVLAAGRPFGHYMVQALAPAAVLLAVALGRRGRAAAISGAMLLLGMYLLVNQFWVFWFSHGTLRTDYYANWLAYVAGRRDRAAYERFFDWRVPNQEAIARAVRADGGEPTLFVWGEYPWTYTLADARNPTRFSTSYHTFLAPEAKVEVMGDIERAPPRYIAAETEEWRRLPGLAELLATRYEPVARIDNTVLWQRK
jgi:4-amino-4-deoxy-L-arabinose transferase-like glycosyltransferase